MCGRYLALAPGPPLYARPGRLALKRGTDVMLAVLSGETYNYLVARGWSAAECRAFIVRVLTAELLG